MDCSDTMLGRSEERQAGSPRTRSTASSGSWLPALLATVLLGLLCGCGSNNDNGMAGAFFLDQNKDLTSLSRVALVELDNTSAYPRISEEISHALYLEIQKQQLFGLTLVQQEDPAWKSLQENFDTLQAMRQLVVLRETLRSNGLLLGTITQYQPYPHMVIGLRLKLLDLTNGQLLWATEQIWDSTDKNIQRRIRRYQRSQLRSGSAPLNEELAVVSSLNFCKFVAYEVAATLRPSRER